MQLLVRDSHRPSVPCRSQTPGATSKQERPRRQGTGLTLPPRLRPGTFPQIHRIPHRERHRGLRLSPDSEPARFLPWLFPPLPTSYPFRFHLSAPDSKEAPCHGPLLFQAAAPIPQHVHRTTTLFPAVATDHKLVGTGPQVFEKSAERGWPGSVSRASGATRFRLYGPKTDAPAELSMAPCLWSPIPRQSLWPPVQMVDPDVASARIALCRYAPPSRLPSGPYPIEPAISNSSIAWRPLPGDGLLEWHTVPVVTE